MGCDKQVAKDGTVEDVCASPAVKGPAPGPQDTVGNAGLLDQMDAAGDAVYDTLGVLGDSFLGDNVFQGVMGLGGEVAKTMAAVEGGIHMANPLAGGMTKALEAANYAPRLSGNMDIGAAAGVASPMMTVANAILAPIGLVGGINTAQDALTNPEHENGSSFTLGMEGLGSAIAGGTGIMGLMGDAAIAAELVAAGELAALGPLGAVAGGAAMGFTGGRYLDEGADWLGDKVMGQTTRWNSDPSLTTDEEATGDHSLSGLGAWAMADRDLENARMLEALGVGNEEDPTYTKTVGWQINNGIEAVEAAKDDLLYDDDDLAYERSVGWKINEGIEAAGTWWDEL
jgi:hypothetical protein